MLILDQHNVNLKRLINIQKCHSCTELDHCALYGAEEIHDFMDTLQAKKGTRESPVPILPMKQTNKHTSEKFV